MKHDCIYHLTQNGIALDDAVALRRIAMTLHRWHELECGDSNQWNSFSLVRGKRLPKDETGKRGFEYDDNGKPYLEIHHNSGGTSYAIQPDRERGAKKRLAKIMARYPGFDAYIQGDPRGASLYILNRSTTPQPYDQFYSRGIAVYK
jgi:hypothetical protein